MGRLQQYIPKGRLGIAFLLLCLVYLFVLLRTAWLSDDAFITYRCVNNLVQGHGFGFNADERVQAFTHPLWALLHVPIQAFSDNIYYPAIFFSMLVSMLVMLLVWRLPLPGFQKLLLAAAMILSKAYIDFSSSGLENPLSHLLALGFFACWISDLETKRKILLISLIAGLSVFNRMDTLLLYLPALLQLAWQHRSWRTLLLLALGFSPFLLWEMFSLLYFGFAFPNTAYAKLNSGIPKMELIMQGLRYVQDLLIHDPLTFGCIALALLAVMLRKSKRHLAPALGILLYLIYTINVGGDFMRGRFFTLPFLLACLIGADISQSLQAKWRWALWLPIVIGGCFSANATIFSGKEYGKGAEFHFGIADERAYYFSTTGLLNAEGEMPKHRWAENGRRMAASKPGVHDVTALGMMGYYAGPQQHFVDVNALADPLLARLPAFHNPGWRIGHFERLLPDGYLGSIRTGQPMLKDEGMNAYLSKLNLLTRGPIWDSGRFKEIVRFALGKNDHLLPKAHFVLPVEQPLPIEDLPDTLEMHCTEGLCIAFPKDRKPTGIKFRLLGGSMAYSLVLRQGEKILWSKLLNPDMELAGFPPGQMFEIPLPTKISQADNLVLFPQICPWRCQLDGFEWVD
jgi:arabinofuranosyltransferase